LVHQERGRATHSPGDRVLKTQPQLHIQSIFLDKMK
jgi:hypothetical protein